MICISNKCNNGKVKCVETRASRSQAETLRRYKCQTCATSFFTEERFSKESAKAMQSDQQRADNFARLSLKPVN